MAEIPQQYGLFPNNAKRQMLQGTYLLPLLRDHMTRKQLLYSEKNNRNRRNRKRTVLRHPEMSRRYFCPHPPGRCPKSSSSPLPLAGKFPGSLAPANPQVQPVPGILKRDIKSLLSRPDEVANCPVHRARLYRCITGFPSVSEIEPEFPWEAVTGVTFFNCNIVF